MSLRADPHGSGVGVELGIACGRALARRCASKTFRQVRVAGFGPNRQTGPRSGTGLSIRGHCQLTTFNSARQGAPGPPPRGSRPREEGTDRVKSLVSVCSAFAAGIKLADRTLRAHQRPGGVLRLRRREPGMAHRAPGPASIAWTGEQGRRPAQGHCLDAGDAALQPAARRHPG